jgi:DNA-binding response OmpR family regulator
LSKLILIVAEARSGMQDIEMALQAAGFTVETCSQPVDVPRLVIDKNPFFVLLEQELRSTDGLDLCRRLRQICNTPVIMMAERRRRTDVIAALSSGADDYVVKPVDPEELLARIRAIARRGSNPAPIAGYDDGEWQIDFLKREVVVHNRRVSLSATEFNVLTYLVQNGGRVVPMAEILSAVWGPNCTEDVEYARLYIWYLRQKLELDPRRPKRIMTKRGVGYLFERRNGRVLMADANTTAEIVTAKV